MTAENRYTRDELLEALRSLARKTGRSPRIVDLKEADGFPSVNQYLSAFGSWNKAKEAAGLQTFRKEGRGEPYSDEELLNKLRELDRHTDGLVTKEDMQEAEETPSAITYQRRFGSWNKAKKLAGLETIQPDETKPQYSDEELLAMLRTLSRKLGRSVTIPDLERAEGYPEPSTFEQRFGSWNKAKKAAGLETFSRGERRTQYSREELLEKLRQLADEREETITRSDVDEAENVPSTTTYTRRFGSWKNAKRLAGIKK